MDIGEPLKGLNFAERTAFCTQSPVGVPASGPLTVAEETDPDLPITTPTSAVPGTLNCSKQAAVRTDFIPDMTSPRLSCSGKFGSTAASALGAAARLGPDPPGTDSRSSSREPPPDGLAAGRGAGAAATGADGADVGAALDPLLLPREDPLEELLA